LTRVKSADAPARSSAESHLALGALLAFYRRVRWPSKTQAEIAKAAHVTPSALGMFESGKRLPSPDTVDRLAAALGLDSFQAEQLKFIGAYSRQGPLIGEQWFVPEDVLAGTPIFLRDIAHERIRQIEASISEMWIVTSHPLAQQDEMYQALKDRIIRQETDFVYFIDSSVGESPIRALWSRIAAEEPDQRTTLLKRLRCVLIPRSFCLDHYAICNPGQLPRMYGRMIIYASGIPRGFLSMDTQQVLRAYHLLAPIYQQIQLQPELSTEYGDFRRVDPEL
jgi:transcriptional regulator with XRE-family HTH domain